MRFGLRKPSWRKSFGAYRSQWKRMLMRFFFPLTYGRKGWGWLHDPKKASYNWWYNRTTVSVDRLLGIKPADKRFGLFCCALASIFLFPFDFVGSGAKVAKEAHREHKERKARNASQNQRSYSSNTGSSDGSSSYNQSSRGETTANSGSSNSYSAASKTSTPKNESSKERTYTRTATASTTMKSSSSHSIANAKPKSSVTKSNITISQTIVETKTSDESKSDYSVYTSLFERHEDPIIEKPQPAPEPVPPDENTPKSTPKNEKDQYIRKRMIIAGSYYCDNAVLEKLNIGTYFDVSADPTNPYDKDAVMLSFEGNKIGYIAKTDKIAFVTCLKLKRKIYGVITDIITENGRTQYEYETWFDHS